MKKKISLVFVVVMLLLALSAASEAATVTMVFRNETQRTIGWGYARVSGTPVYGEDLLPEFVPHGASFALSVPVQHTNIDWRVIFLNELGSQGDSVEYLNIPVRADRTILLQPNGRWRIEGGGGSGGGGGSSGGGCNAGSGFLALGVLALAIVRKRS